MDWDTLAPMLVMITAILTAGGVLVLRPLSKRVAELLEVLVKRERALAPGPEVEQLRELLVTLESRLAVLEERQEFTDSLLVAGDARVSSPADPRLSAAGDGRAAPLPAASEPAPAAARIPPQSARR